MTLIGIERSPRLAELKITYKRNWAQRGGTERSRRPIKEWLGAEESLRSVWNRDTLELIEDFVVVLLDGGHVPLGWLRTSSGELDRAVVDLRVVFGTALQAAASAIIVAHNHPSGSVEPSVEDRAVTQQLHEAGQLLNVPLLDHIILSKEAIFSFAEQGLR